MGNTYGIAVNLLLQIVLVPIYLHYWGVDLYADWITISAFTAFFSMSDIGLNTVTMNSYSISYHNGETKRCDSLIANNAALIIFCFSLILVLIICLSFFVSFSNLFNLTHISNRLAFLILICLSLKIGITMLANLHASILRAKAKAYVCFVAGNTMRLSEGLIMVLGLVIGLELKYLILLYCTPSVILFVFYHVITRQYDFSIKLGLIDRKLFISILAPSISFMAFPLGYAIILQGFTLLVNSHFGAIGVVQYNTTRTLCNFVKVIPNSIKNSTWPEFTNAFAVKAVEKMRKLYKFTILSSFAIVMTISTVILLFGNLIYEFWTHGEVEFYTPLAVAFVIETILNTAWEASTMTLMATNKHSTFGWTFVGLALMAWITALSATNILDSVPIYSVVYPIIIMDTILLVYSLIKTKKLFSDLQYA